MNLSSTANACKMRALRKILRLSRKEGALVEVVLLSGESLDGYWVCSLGKTRVGFSNATIEENREAPILVPLEGIRRVSLLV